MTGVQTCALPILIAQTIAHRAVINGHTVLFATAGQLTLVTFDRALRAKAESTVVLG